MRAFLSQWGPPVPSDAGDAVPPDFAAQCEALIEARRRIVSSVMGVYPSAFVAATEAAGHRLVRGRVDREGSQDRRSRRRGRDRCAGNGSRRPSRCVRCGDGRAGARWSVVVGAGNRRRRQAAGRRNRRRRRCPRCSCSARTRRERRSNRNGILTVPGGTDLTRRGPRRSAEPRPRNRREPRVQRPLGPKHCDGVRRAATAADAPTAAAYPVQRGLTAAMRSAAAKTGDIDRMQAWAGQSAALRACRTGSTARRAAVDRSCSQLSADRGASSAFVRRLCGRNSRRRRAAAAHSARPARCRRKCCDRARETPRDCDKEAARGNRRASAGDAATSCCSCGSSRSANNCRFPSADTMSFHPSTRTAYCEPAISVYAGRASSTP